MSIKFVNFDNYPIIQNMEFQNVESIDKIIQNVKNIDKDKKMIIYMNGIAGCGKSRVCKRLNDYLTSNNKKTYILSKDDFRYTENGYVFTKEYEPIVSKNYTNKFKNLIKSKTYNYIILDNTHINYEKIEDTRKIYKNYNFDELIISIEPFKDLNKHINFNIHNIPFAGINRQFEEWNKHKKLIEDLKIKTIIFNHFEDGFIQENQINMMCKFFKYYLEI